MKKLCCIPKIEELASFLAFSSQYDAAFEYNDFYLPQILDDSIATERIIRAYQETGRDLSQDTLHGAFLDICVNSEDPMIFRASDYRVRQCMDIAQKMGLRAVIFHTNYIANFPLRSYQKGWVARNEEYWSQLLQDYPSLTVYLENMFDDSPHLLAELAGRLREHPRFGVCFDIAHARLSGSPMENWYEEMRPFARHLHINDNDGQEDLHMAAGAGTVCWQQFSQWCQSLSHPLSVLIEVRSWRELMASVRFLQENHIFPFS